MDFNASIGESNVEDKHTPLKRMKVVYRIIKYKLNIVLCSLRSLMSFSYVSMTRREDIVDAHRSEYRCTKHSIDVHDRVSMYRKTRTMGKR